jgi:transposase
MQNDNHQDSHNGVADYRRIEVITGSRRRRQWSAEERRQIVAESFEPGANISAIARRHGVNGGLLHYWRKCARETALEVTGANQPSFVPVAIAGPALAEAQERSKPAAVIEIEIGGVIVRIPSEAGRDMVGVVIAALRGKP